MTKIYYLTRTDPAGEIHGLNFMVRAKRPEDAIAAWVNERGGDPSTVEAHVVTDEDDVAEYLLPIHPIL